MRNQHRVETGQGWAWRGKSEGFMTDILSCERL
jgi:hypothetical protein